MIEEFSTFLIDSYSPKHDAPRCGLGLFDPVPRKSNSIVRPSNERLISFTFEREEHEDHDDDDDIAPRFHQIRFACKSTV